MGRKGTAASKGDRGFRRPAMSTSAAPPPQSTGSIWLVLLCEEVLLQKLLGAVFRCPQTSFVGQTLSLWVEQRASQLRIPHGSWFSHPCNQEEQCNQKSPSGFPFVDSLCKHLCALGILHGLKRSSCFYHGSSVSSAQSKQKVLRSKQEDKISLSLTI